ncbi:unnamed protein product [Schistosoma turkestanicum]|nr:unnamed protein product [Schistosoma turkestanicum]
MFSQKLISSTSLYCSYNSRRQLFSAQIKKFYKNVTIFQSTHENYQYPVFQILLDQRQLRTPSGIHFYVPNQALAVAVAHEWDSQVDTIKRYTMPLTTLCNRALDTPDDQRDVLVSAIMQYVDTDTICFRSQEPDDLVKVQSISWNPIINWINKTYQIKPMITDSLTSLAKLSLSDKEKLTRHFRSYNIWGLTG